MVYPIRLPLAATVFACAVPAAHAATMNPFLVADQSSRQILLATDVNGNGHANDAGEVGAFFGANNWAGLPTGSANFYALTQARTGHVYANDGGNKAVYRLYDRDGDGNANGQHEANLWFSAADNAGGYGLGLPNGVAEGADGAIYVTSGPFHHHETAEPARVYRTVDLDGDGNANGAGEVSVWLDFSDLTASSSPFEISFIKDTAYVVDSASGTVFRARDADGDGRVSADEVTSFITADNPWDAPVRFAIGTSAEDVYLWQWVADADGLHSAFRLRDLNGDGVIDEADEVLKVWDSSHLGEDYAFTAGFGMDALSDGQLVLTANGGTPGSRSIIYLRDLDGDGLFFGEGETLLALSQLDHGTYPTRPRDVAFYSAPAPVPLPATLPALAGAFGLLASLRRRRG